MPRSLFILFTLVYLIRAIPTEKPPPNATSEANETSNKVDLTPSSAAFRGYLSNPSDFATILLIIGGDIVCKTLAQLSGSPYGAPIAFSFGWVSYSFSALASVVGDGRLMPKPEFSSIVINVNSGYTRNNDSWVLSRILRDLELDAPKRRGGLSVTIMHAIGQKDAPKRDWVWYIGVFVIPVQFGIALIPWVLYRNWSIFLIVATGTLLALFGSMLPQWAAEKWDNDRRIHSSYCLTRGNGFRHVFVIQNQSDSAINLEDMATSHVQLDSWTENLSRIALGLNALLWVVFIICTGALEADIWYLLGAGFLGMAQNVIVAGAKRTPAAHGVNLQIQEVIEGDRVMKTLQTLEDRYPKTGLSLLPVFFPGELWPEEELFWAKKKAELDHARRERIARKAVTTETKVVNS